MSSHVDGLLAELETALEDEAFDEAEAIAAELQGAYDARRDEELDRSTQAATVAADEASVSGDAASQLQNVIQVDGSTRVVRSILLLLVPVLSESADELRSAGELQGVLDTASATIDELRSLEDDLSNAAADADAVIDDVEVPATLRLEAVSLDERSVVVAGSTTLSVTVKNAGERPANDITVGFLFSDGMVGERDEIAVDSLAPGESVTESVTVRGTEPGSQSIEVSASGSDVDATRRNAVLSVSDGDPPPSGDDDDADGADGGDDDTGEGDDVEPPGSDDADEDGSGGQPSIDDDALDDSVPGFGVGSALTAIGSVGYVLKRRLDSDDDAE